MSPEEVDRECSSRNVVGSPANVPQRLTGAKANHLPTQQTLYHTFPEQTLPRLDVSLPGRWWSAAQPSQSVLKSVTGRKELLRALPVRKLVTEAKLDIAERTAAK